MTTTEASTFRSLPAHDRGQDDSSVLWQYLSPRCFPATRDELQATLVRHHAPGRLLWELTRLSSSRRYASLEQVREALEHPPRPSLPLEPI